MRSQYPPGPRMILDAILLTSAQICSAQQRKVAILPGLRIAQEEGVRIAHPVSGYEVWLSGNVDYAVIEYEDEDNRGTSGYCGTLSLRECSIYGPIRPFTRSGWIQRGCTRHFDRSHAPRRSQRSECRAELRCLYPKSR
jgi:hypothetical protein